MHVSEASNDATVSARHKQEASLLHAAIFEVVSVMLALHCIVKQMRRRYRRITRTHGGLDGTVGNGEDLGDIKLDFSNSQLKCQHFRRPVSKDEMIRTSAITLACDCSQEGKENERRVHLG